MSLSKGTSKEARQENIEREVKAGKDPKQAAAIAYSEQRHNIAKKSHSGDNSSVLQSLRNSLANLLDRLTK